MAWRTWKLGRSSVGLGRVREAVCFADAHGLEVRHRESGLVGGEDLSVVKWNAEGLRDARSGRRAGRLNVSGRLPGYPMGASCRDVSVNGTAQARQPQVPRLRPRMISAIWDLRGWVVWMKVWLG